MAKLLDIEADPTGALEALDRVGVGIERHLKVRAKETADNIAAEARRRVRRRTGVTASMIHVEEAKDGSGYVVLPWDAAWEATLVASGNNDDLVYAVPRWLEFGTEKMLPREYFIVSARLEEGAHARRIAEAIQEAIDEQGLGD